MIDAPVKPEHDRNIVLEHDRNIVLEHDRNIVPEALTKDEKNILEKLDASDNFKPNTSIKEKIFKKFKSFFD